MTPQQARAELARRELARRESAGSTQSKKESGYETIGKTVSGMFTKPVTAPKDLTTRDIGGIAGGAVTGLSQGVAPALFSAVEAFQSKSPEELLNRASSGGYALGGMRLGANLAQGNIDRSMSGKIPLSPIEIAQNARYGNLFKDERSAYPQAETPTGKLYQGMAELAGGLATGNVMAKFADYSATSPIRKAVREAEKPLISSYRKTSEVEIPKIKKEISNINSQQKRYDDVAKRFKDFREKTIRGEISKKSFESGAESQKLIQDLNKSKTQLNQNSGTAIQGIVKQAKDDAKNLAIVGRNTYKELNADLSNRFEKAVSPYLSKQISADEASDLIRSSFNDAGIDLDNLEGAEKVLKNQLDKIEAMIGGEPEKVLDAVGGVSYSKPQSGSVSLGELYETLKSLKKTWGSKFKSGDRISASFNRKLMERFPEFKDVRSSFSDEYTQMNRLADIFDPYNIDRSYDIDRPYKKILQWAQKGIDPNDADIADVIQKKFPKGYLDSPLKAKSSLDSIREQKQKALMELTEKKNSIEVGKKQTSRNLKLEEEARLSELNARIIDKVNKFNSKKSAKISELQNQLTQKEKEQITKASFLRFIESEAQKGNLAQNLARKVLGVVVGLKTGGVSPLQAKEAFDITRLRSRR